MSEGAARQSSGLELYAETALVLNELFSDGFAIFLG
jgi:hypothetical protein